MRYAFAGLWLSLCIATPCLADDLPVVNIMPAFVRAWTEGTGKSMAERVRLMKELVLEPNREAYNSPQFALLDDVHLAWYLDDVGPLVPDVIRISDVLQRNLPSYERRFATAFPDFRPQSKIFFMPSLLNFDGQTRRGVLRFGVDGIVKYDGPNADVGLIVEHELFHLYHGQIQEAQHAQFTGQLWERLWGEGLATYVSYRLSPGATPSQALLGTRLGTLSPGDTTKLACAIEPKLDTQETAAFLDAGTSPPGLPARGAYLIGFLAASHLGEKLDLRSLAALGGATLHDDVVRRGACPVQPLVAADP